MIAPTQPLVLVVDDEPQIQRFLKPALVAAGYRVAAAADGAHAIRFADMLQPAAIILDLGLPDMDGKDVIAAGRRATGRPRRSPPSILAPTTSSTSRSASASFWRACAWSPARPGPRRSRPGRSGPATSCSTPTRIASRAPASRSG